MAGPEALPATTARWFAPRFLAPRSGGISIFLMLGEPGSGPDGATVADAVPIINAGAEKCFVALSPDADKLTFLCPSPPRYPSRGSSSSSSVHSSSSSAPSLLALAPLLNTSRMLGLAGSAGSSGGICIDREDHAGGSWPQDFFQLDLPPTYKPALGAPKTDLLR